MLNLIIDEDTVWMKNFVILANRAPGDIEQRKIVLIVLNLGIKQSVAAGSSCEI